MQFHIASAHLHGLSTRDKSDEAGNTPAPQVERRWLKKVRRIPESQPLLAPKIDPGVFEAVSDALYRECKLRIHYRNAQGKLSIADVRKLLEIARHPLARP